MPFSADLAPTDFDFMIGSWTVAHRRLNSRLVGCSDWTEFTGTSTTRKILRGFAVLIALALGSGGCATGMSRARTPGVSSDWGAVRALAPGSTVVVERRDQTRVVGRTRSVDDDSLELKTKTDTLLVQRTEVLRLLHTRRLTASRATRGLALGGVGVLQGLLLTKSDRLLFAGLFGAGWAAIGATAGALNGASQTQTDVVYVAASSIPQPNLEMQPTRRVSLAGARPLLKR